MKCEEEPSSSNNTGSLQEYFLHGCGAKIMIILDQLGVEVRSKIIIY